MKRRLLIAAGVALCAWLAVGAAVVAHRAPRVAASGDIRGAWHVHTTHSDGRGTLTEVVAAAKAAGLQFVVVTDHNVLTPEEQGFRDGVLVVQGTEASTRFGHVVAIGVPRALVPAEREGDPLGAIAVLGGHAILAHPLHPSRPFTGWGRGAWRGLEIVSSDTAWAEVIAERAWGRAALAAAVLPFDGARAVLALDDGSADERRRFDDELRTAPRAEPGTARKVLFCSADAHGYPSYEAAFSAFSMHLPLALSGDAAADVRAVVAALTDGSAACVFDGVAPATGVRLSRAGRGLELRVEAPDLRPARFTLLRDGVPVDARPAPAPWGAAVVTFECGGGCPPGDYRVEGRWDGRPWIFTNPVAIE
jgi:PHP domain